MRRTMKDTEKIDGRRDAMMNTFNGDTGDGASSEMLDTGFGDNLDGATAAI